jgi:hypothetical protein
MSFLATALTVTSGIAERISLENDGGGLTLTDVGRQTAATFHAEVSAELNRLAWAAGPHPQPG